MRRKWQAEKEAETQEVETPKGQKQIRYWILNSASKNTPLNGFDPPRPVHEIQ